MILMQSIKMLQCDLILNYLQKNVYWSYDPFMFGTNESPSLLKYDYIRLHLIPTLFAAVLRLFRQNILNSTHACSIYRNILLRVQHTTPYTQMNQLDRSQMDMHEQIVLLRCCPTRLHTSIFLSYGKFHPILKYSLKTIKNQSWIFVSTSAN